MDIYFEAKRLFYNNTGLGNYSRWLLDEYSKRYQDNNLILLKPGDHQSAFQPTYSTFPFQTKTYSNALGIKRTFNLYDIVSNRSVFHGMSAELPFQKTKKNIKKIVTIHDLIFLERKSDYQWIDRMIYTKKLENAIVQADQIICISEFTKNSLLKYYQHIDSKIKVVYQNCSQAFYEKWKSDEISELKNKYTLPELYWICVSSMNPRKNLQSIIEAYKIIPESSRIPFLFVGRGSESTNLKKTIHNYKLEKYFIFLDSIPNELLPGLYQGSIGLIYPSLIEGFGIPAVEAMASQIPIIIHHNTVLEEVIQGAGWSINCNKGDELSNAILELQSNASLHSQLVHAADGEIKKFDNDHLMLKYREIYTSNK